MKTLKFLFAGLFLLTMQAHAQVNVNVTIGTPPVWGPTGYAEARYYYIPDIEVYYDIPSAMFIYFDGDGWIRAAYLPYRFRHYNLYDAYKVCLHDYGPNPYIYYKKHRKIYYHGYRGPVQKMYGNRPQVVYNGPINGYREERKDNDRGDYYRNLNDNRGERRSNNEYRTENNGSRDYRNDNGRSREKENDRGNENERGNRGGNRGNQGHHKRG